MARRARTLDPVLERLRAQIRARLESAGGGERTQERRASARAAVRQDARLVVGDLAVEGSIDQLSASGVFFRSDVLVEAGERGTLEIAGSVLGVRVASSRTATTSQTPGLGIAFEPSDADAERRLLELLLRLLGGA